MSPNLTVAFAAVVAVALLCCAESARLSGRVINSTSLNVSSVALALAPSANPPLTKTLKREVDNKFKKKAGKKGKKKKKKSKTEPLPIVGPPGKGNGLVVASSIQEATIEVVKESFERANSSIRAIVYSE